MKKMFTAALLTIILALSCATVAFAAPEHVDSDTMCGPDGEIVEVVYDYPDETGLSDMPTPEGPEAWDAIPEDEVATFLADYEERLEKSETTPQPFGPHEDEKYVYLKDKWLRGHDGFDLSTINLGIAVWDLKDGETIWFSPDLMVAIRVYPDDELPIAEGYYNVTGQVWVVSERGLPCSLCS